MNRIIECLTVEHDLALVALAATVCLLACYTGYRLFGRIGGAGFRSNLWLLAAAVSLGVGVWATHFIGMLAYRSSLPIGFDLPVTLLSALIAIVFIASALWLLRQGEPLFAGLTAGLAVTSMHFVGMYALQGPVHIVWDSNYIVAALVLGISLSVVAFFLAGKSSGWRDETAFTGLMVLAICALHFIAMAAVEIRINPLADLQGWATLERTVFAVAVAALTSVTLCIALMLAFIDQFANLRDQREQDRLRHYVEELETTQAALEARSSDLRKALDETAALSQSKSQFLAIMSHELRTPLNAIIGFSELMQMEPKGPLGHPSYNEYLSDILNSGKHLLQLINAVLDFSKIEAGQMKIDDEEIDVAELLAECCRMMDQQASNNDLTLQSDFEAGLPLLRADRSKMRQIVLNLVSNAIKFTRPGGSVTLSALVNSDGFVIRVADTGVGIEPENIALATEVFGQVDNSLSREHEGTGLGLPLCIRMAELHDGSLDLQSQPGVGTTVEVRFPEDRFVRCRKAMNLTEARLASAS
ncbi:MHYT domain-containing protein [Minwuia sp.]|uniref:sensor histidine kinase n=1 Tax=Minwuia sp. TaxID=2493630 RepID=UPI003A8E781C